MIIYFAGGMSVMNVKGREREIFESKVLKMASVVFVLLYD